MEDMHRIYIKPWGIKEKDWYTRAYRMEQQDIEEIIKEWPEEWKNPAIDLSDSDDDQEQETKKEKEKEKIGEKKKKEHTGEKRKASQEESMPRKRQKRKAHKLPTDARLGSVDYDNIATYVQDTLEGSMTAIVSLQTEMKSVLDMEIAELKTLLEQTTQILTATTRTSGTPWGGSIAQGRTRFFCILPTIVRLPLGSPIEQIGFIKVDLAGIPTDALQMVQVQVREELRDRELVTY